MYDGADKVQKKYRSLNEADGPVFKIQNDPRFTKFGKLLARTGLDELPQLINIIKGEMSFVGPRPLPIQEANKIPKKYQNRFSLLPGITSLWVAKGSHRLTFHEWMRLDIDYKNNKNLITDIFIVLHTVKIILKSIYIELFNLNPFTKPEQHNRKKIPKSGI
jgi:lipopolysaccharide/colanic/teichoic acid biosynthesis glycosyltransferase